MLMHGKCPTVPSCPNASNSEFGNTSQRQQLIDSAIRSSRQFLQGQVAPPGLPIHTGDEPLPLRHRQGAHRGVGAGPSEVATMQAPLAQPDAGAIPDQELVPVLAAAVEGVGAA